MSWTPELIEELKSLWTAGHSASVIGKRLGVSKNAVVGKAHRLKLPARPSPIRKDARPAPRRRPASLALPPVPRTPEPEVSLPPPEVIYRPARPKRTGASRQHCQWPIGDPSDQSFHFCGEPAAEGKPYCPQHCQVAYIRKARDDSQAA